MPDFKLESTFNPTGDQPRAISALTEGLNAGLNHQVLLGVTGSGKTFTMANVIDKVQKPTLVISHNKTLAGQLYQEYRDFFPDNAVEYFVSYYDYYQPEAYIPQTDTYIAKDASVNDFIEKLRLSTTTSLVTRKDVIVIASVSCIYNLGSPVEYAERIIRLSPGMKLRRQDLFKQLVNLHYQRNDYDFKRATFRVRGDTVDIWPAYGDEGIRVEILNDTLTALSQINPLTGKKEADLDSLSLYPARHYLTAESRKEKALQNIRADLIKQLQHLEEEGKEIEAYRLKQRTEYDLEMIEELGYCNGIENYSRYFDQRNPGDPPFTLLDFFIRKHKDFLIVIDESHMTVPQIQGMYRGDRARKETLIKHGFRLPSALDNRPLTLNEFLAKASQIVYTSATPSEWELEKAKKSALDLPSPPHSLESTPKGLPYRHTPGVIEQLVRPTGLLDPKIEVRGTQNQIQNLIDEIIKRQQQNERVLVTTLTKRMAEELSRYLKDQDVKATYLHADVDTLDRSDILEELRKGEYEVVVGINLLREGLDLPEVSLVAILDADKEGFLRSTTSLIQVMGRAARHEEGRVIMYADTITQSMQKAIDEVEHRRRVQEAYNRKHQIIPQTIKKPIRKKLIQRDSPVEERPLRDWQTLVEDTTLSNDPDKIKIRRLTREMDEAAAKLEFEKAAFLRDQIEELKNDRS